MTIDAFRRARGGAGNRSASRASAAVKAWPGLLLAGLLPLLAVAQSTPSGTVLRNVAQVAYSVEGEARTTLTNEVALRTEPAASRGRVALARYAASVADVALRATAGPPQCLGSAGLV